MKNPTNIWFISKYVCPVNRNGTGTRGFLLMSELVKRGKNITLFTSDSNHLIDPPSFKEGFFKEEVMGINIIWLKTLKYSKTKSLKRMLSWLDFEVKLFFFNKAKIAKPDLIIVSSLSLFTILNGIYFKYRYGCKLVFEIRDIWPLLLTELKAFSKWNPFILGLGIIEKLGYKFSDLIVGTMPNLNHHLSKINIKKNAYCIPMGLDMKVYANQKKLDQSYIEKYIPKDKFIVGHLGSIGTNNGLNHLIEAAKKLQSNSKIHFLIVGDGDLKNFYIHQTASLKNISIIPKVPKNNVQDLLNICDLAYFSTVKVENWNSGQSLNKIIDYMYAAKPILATYSGFPSMINESGCGEFIPHEGEIKIEQKFVEYSNMPKSELLEMGAKGKEWLIKNRTYSLLADKYLDLIKNI